MFLANTARNVRLLIRGGDLAKSMSAYLCERVEKHPKIEVMKHTEVSQIDGNGSVRSIQIKNNQTEETTAHDCAALFIFVGARPHTDWLPEEVVLDEKGFVLTGSAIGEDVWPLERRVHDEHPRERQRR